MIVSFMLPPTGAIDSSVIIATSELFAFATLATVIEAVEKGKRVSIRKGETEMEVGDNPDQEQE